MRGLQEPPKKAQPTRTVSKAILLVILILVLGTVVFAFITTRNISSTEVRSIESLELETRVEVDGLGMNVTTDPGGPLPVVILHDFDMTGSLPLEPLSLSLGSRHHGVRIDLPGFGYSDRITSPGSGHTVSSMAARVATVLEERFSRPVTVVGVGFGGEVAAEVAFSRPELVRSLVMVDTDFFGEPGLPTSAGTYPLVGKPVLFLFHGGGAFAEDAWAPHCPEGGWCPTDGQLAERANRVGVAGTTDSLQAFLTTPPSAIAATNLDEIAAPMAYVWSSKGPVSEDVANKVQRDAGDLVLVVSDTFQAAYEDVDAILEALLSVEP